jgi:hypothetical protein
MEAGTDIRAANAHPNALHENRNAVKPIFDIVHHHQILRLVGRSLLCRA